MIFPRKERRGPASDMTQTCGRVIVSLLLLDFLLLFAPSTLADCSGGCSTTTVGGDTVHIFTSNGTFIPPADVTEVRYLVVGGGGGGGGTPGVFFSGSSGGGGGGAGGVLSGTGFSVTPLTSYSIVVGGGGAAGNDSTRGGSGGNSSFSTRVAAGGGGGGASSNGNGITGGSGGGGFEGGSGGNGTGGQGNAGGSGGSTRGGGGGGANGAGDNGGGGNGAGGNGGTGQSDNITGTNVTYAEGGNGGAYGQGRSNGASGTANRGNGGSGANGDTAFIAGAQSGGAGGSGIVVIRYTTPPRRYYSRSGGAWTGNNRWSLTGCGGTSAGNAEPGEGDRVTICNGHAVQLDTSAFGNGLASLTINAGGELQMASSNTVQTLTIAGDLVNNGTLTIPTNRNITSSLEIRGNITSTGTFDLAPDNNSRVRVTFTGGGNHTIDGNGAMRFYQLTVEDNLIINKSGGVITQTSAFDVNGNLQITAGAINLEDTVTVDGSTTVGGTLGITTTSGTRTFNGNVTINSGGIWNHTANAPVTLNGNLTNNGSFNANTGAAAIYTFSGGSAQTITGTAAGTTVFARLTLNNAAGLSLTGNHNVEVSALLTLASGRISTSSNYVYISNGSAISGAGANDFIAGNLRKRYTATGNQTRVYEVGTVSGGIRYAPVSVTLGAVTATGDFTVSSTAGDHPDIGASDLNAGLSINRYWTLMRNSVNFNASANNSIVFTFINPGDYDSGANFNNFIVGRYNTPAWTEVTPAGTTATTATISGTGITAANITADYQVIERAQSVTVFAPATGGNAISADTNSTSGTGTYTGLAGLDIRELDNGGLRPGSYTLTAPAGFQFDPGTSVNIAVNVLSGSGSNLTLSSTSVTPTTSTITLTVATASGGSRLNSLTFTNLRVRPVADCPLATSGNIVFASLTSTTVVNGNAGTLTEVAGAAARMYTLLPGQGSYTGSSCGTITGSPSAQGVDVPFNLDSLVVTDQFGNVQTGYDNAGVPVAYTYSAGGGPSFTTPVSFTDGISTTVLTTLLDTPGTHVTITATDGVLSGVASTPFAVVNVATCGPMEALQSGLPGQYFNNINLAGAATNTRVDAPIDFNWGAGSAGVAGVGADTFSVRWEGLLRVTSSGNYQFQVEADDGVRLYVDNVLVINQWIDQSATTWTSGTVALSAGAGIPIRLEYYENGGDAVIRLRWRPASGSYTAIPAGPLPTQGAGLYHCAPLPPPKDLVVTMNGTVDNINAGSILLSGTLNGDPEVVNTNTNTGNDAITTNITTLTDYSWLVDVAGSGNAGSFTAGAGQTERWDTSADSSTGAMSTEQVVMAGTNSMTQVHSDSNRNAHIVTAFAPGPASLIEFDSAFENDDDNTGTLSWDHLVPFDFNGKLIVGIAVEDDSCSGNQMVASVTHEGMPLTFAASETVSSGGFCVRVEIWYRDFGTPPPSYACPSGLASGITGEYFNITAPPSSPLPNNLPDGTRRDGPINFSWAGGSPGVPGINANDFAVRWNGILRVTQSGNYRFQTSSDDGVRLWIDDELILDNWTDHSAALNTSSNIPLKAGQLYPLRLEYYENDGDSVLSLSWQRPSDGGFSIIPAGPFPVLGEGLYECATLFLDHYTISHAGNGVTCLSEQVTISAINNNGDPIDPGNATLSLAVNPVAPGPPPPKGDWVRVSAGSGTLGNRNSNGTADYQFPGNGETSVTLVFNYTALEPGNNTETINFDVIDSNGITDTGNHNALTDPDLTMSLTGFQFYNEHTGDQNIPVQIAGKPSNAPPNDDVLTLRAVRASDNDPNQCVAAFPDAAVVPVLFGAECRSPATCAGRQVSINGTPVFTNADNSGSGTIMHAPVNLLFEDHGGVSRAELVLNYPDVGEMQLHARYEIPKDEGGTPPAGGGSGGFMEGASSNFIVRPFGFGVYGIEDDSGESNPAADTPAGDLFVSAGTDFRATVAAYVWGVGDDDGSLCDSTEQPECSANDGIPDTHANLGNNNGGGSGAVAPNFRGAAATNVVLTAAAPFKPDAGVGGVPGMLTDSATGVSPIFTAGSFSSGVSGPLATIRYMEAGSMTLQAQSDDYMGTGVPVHGRSSNLSSNPNHGVVGRFGADHFIFTVDEPLKLGPACGNFTYVDQPFDYLVPPGITARAMAADGVTQLHNYSDFGETANWWLLDFGSANTPMAEGINMVYTDLAAPTDISLDTNVADYSPNNGAGTNGEQRFTLSGPFAYAKNTVSAGLQGPFDAKMKLDFSVRDRDGAAGTYTVDPIDFPASELRWGRLAMQNAAGSELLDIEVPLRVEYWDGNAFVVNTEDNCTAIEDLATGITLSNPDSAGGLPQPGDATMTITDGSTQIVSGNVTISNGSGSLVFSAPDDGDGIADTGYVDIEINLDITGTDDSWLRYDWEDADGLADGPYTGNPTGRASFGIFRGSDDFIYIREPWN